MPRRGRFDADRIAARMERNRHRPRVQMKGRQPVLRGPAVDRIAEDRTAEGGEMDTKLVGAPGPGEELEPGESTVAAAHPVVGDRRPAGGIDPHPPAPAVGGDLGEGQGDASRLLRRGTADHRPVGLADAAAGEQPPETREGLAVTAEDQAAAGVAIEPVGEGRRPRQTEAQAVEIVLEIGAAAGSGVDRQPRRLVQDEDQPVTIEQARQQEIRGLSGGARRDPGRGRGSEGGGR